jgi:hypothetical protein
MKTARGEHNLVVVLPRPLQPRHPRFPSLYLGNMDFLVTCPICRHISHPRRFKETDKLIPPPGPGLQHAHTSPREPPFGPTPSSCYRGAALQGRESYRWAACGSGTANCPLADPLNVYRRSPMLSLKFRPPFKRSSSALRLNKLVSEVMRRFVEAIRIGYRNLLVCSSKVPESQILFSFRKHGLRPRASA